MRTLQLVIHQPSAPATPASIRLSTRIWRIIRAWPAPSAILVENSRHRPMVRTSVRLARLAQAISSTNHAATHSEPQIMGASGPLLISRVGGHRWDDTAIGRRIGRLQAPVDRFEFRAGLLQAGAVAAAARPP